ncbi:atlastin-like isoform X2 [Brachionus plicatilis]|uniref:Atlastin-like isoform X2 n=1 Tax=Brachionus plicatilis TaxID=10195 RepID=A0A3M7PR32_BRAPC|nr:atlastin-like isoform X2 [Brachionus plicatilis]
MSGQLPRPKMSAVQIISNQNGKFILDEAALGPILLSSDPNRPLVIISIIGSFRTGKSFLLNKFLNYLTQSELEGFQWSYGSSPHTRGIWMWNTPVPATLPGGREVNLLLMDTQGTFDNETTHRECAVIFSLSAFMSSVQIYNIKNNIERTHLEYLDLFAQYKKVTENLLRREFRFEQLTFLVRDWHYPDEFEYGFGGGDKLLKSRLDNCGGESDEIKEITKNLEFYFKKKNCFLLPHPGQSILKKECRGNQNGAKLDVHFNELSENFFQKIIESIVLDETASVRLNGTNLFEKFKEYVDVLNSQTMPDMESIASIYKKHNNLICKQNLLINHKNYFTKFLNDSIPFVKESVLENEFCALTEQSLENFKLNLIYLDDLELEMENQSLKTEIKIQQSYFRQINNEKKQNFIQTIGTKSLNQYEQNMTEYLSENENYIRPISFFMKHQQVKMKCLEEFDRIRIEIPELHEAFVALSSDLDRQLELYDTEIRLNNSKIVTNLKKQCVEEYINCMAELEDAFVDLEVLNMKHEKALRVTIDKFDGLLPIDCEINTDRENLVNELKGVFSDYLVQNQKRQPKKSPSFTESLNKLMTQSDSGMRKPRLNWHKSPKDLIQATFYVASLVFFLFTSYVIVLNDYVQTSPRLKSGQLLYPASENIALFKPVYVSPQGSTCGLEYKDTLCDNRFTDDKSCSSPERIFFCDQTCPHGNTIQNLNQLDQLKLDTMNPCVIFKDYGYTLNQNGPSKNSYYFDKTNNLCALNTRPWKPFALSTSRSGPKLTHSSPRTSDLDILQSGFSLSLWFTQSGSNNGTIVSLVQDDNSPILSLTIQTITKKVYIKYFCLLKSDLFPFKKIEKECFEEVSLPKLAKKENFFALRIHQKSLDLFVNEPSDFDQDLSVASIDLAYELGSYIVNKSEEINFFVGIDFRGENKFYGWIQDLRVFTISLVNAEVSDLFGVNSNEVRIEPQCRCANAYPRNQNRNSTICLKNKFNKLDQLDTESRLNQFAHPLNYANDDNFKTSWISCILTSTSPIELVLDLENGVYLVQRIEVFFANLPPTRVVIQRFYENRWFEVQRFSIDCDGSDPACGKIPAEFESGFFGGFPIIWSTLIDQEKTFFSDSNLVDSIRASKIKLIMSGYFPGVKNDIRKLYYAINELRVRGRCDCNGYSANCDMTKIPFKCKCDQASFTDGNMLIIENPYYGKPICFSKFTPFNNV